MSRKSLAWFSTVMVVCTGAAITVAQDKHSQRRLGPIPLLSFDDSPEPESGAAASEYEATPVAPLPNLGSLVPSAPAGPLVAELRMLSPTHIRSRENLPRSRDLQVDNDVPNMRVVTKGPDTLIVGRKSTYVIVVKNQSRQKSGAVVVRCSLPAWVELNRHAPSAGRVTASTETDSVEWNVDSVAAGGSQELKLQLTPRAGKPFDLNVELAVQPKRSKTQITIHEPKLKVELKGPKSFVFDEDGQYKVVVSNPGTAPTDDVVLSIMSGGQKLGQKRVGTIPAGTEQIVELDLKADSVGQFPIEAVAVADLGLTNKALTTVQVRRGQPQISIDGAVFEFAGNDAHYNVTVTNVGDAPMKYSTIRMDLPRGTTYVSGLDTPQVSKTDVSWMVDELAAGASKSFPVVVRLSERGQHKFGVSATTGDELVAQASAATSAETSADLKLVVVEPRGPQPISQVVEYEIRVVNVGSDMAKNVSIIAALPPELNAVDVTGNAAIKSGQIFFRPIPQIAKGKEVVHQVKVRAVRAGNHNFRVVVKCQNPDLRFASEDTTRYYDRKSLSRAEAKAPQKLAPLKKVANLPRIAPN